MENKEVVRGLDLMEKFISGAPLMECQIVIISLSLDEIRKILLERLDNEKK